MVCDNGKLFYKGEAQRGVLNEDGIHLSGSGTSKLAKHLKGTLFDLQDIPWVVYETKQDVKTPNIAKVIKGTTHTQVTKGGNGMNNKTEMITEDRITSHMRKHMRIGQRDTGKIGSTTVTTRMIKQWIHNGIAGTGKMGIVIPESVRELPLQTTELLGPAGR